MMMVQQNLLQFSSLSLVYGFYEQVAIWDAMEGRFLATSVFRPMSHKNCVNRDNTNLRRISVNASRQGHTNKWQCHSYHGACEVGNSRICCGIHQCAWYGTYGVFYSTGAPLKVFLVKCFELSNRCRPKMCQITFHQKSFYARISLPAGTSNFQGGLILFSISVDMKGAPVKMNAPYVVLAGGKSIWSMVLSSLWRMINVHFHYSQPTWRKTQCCQQKDHCN